MAIDFRKGFPERTSANLARVAAQDAVTKRMNPFGADGELGKAHHFFEPGDRVEIHAPIGNSHVRGHRGTITSARGTSGRYFVRLDAGPEIDCDETELRPELFASPQESEKVLKALNPFGTDAEPKALAKRAHSTFHVGQKVRVRGTAETAIVVKIDDHAIYLEYGPGRSGFALATFVEAA